MATLGQDFHPCLPLVRAAEKRATDARARWRRVMFEFPRTSPTGKFDRYEIEEANARREMIEADIELCRFELIPSN